MLNIKRIWLFLIIVIAFSVFLYIFVKQRNSRLISQQNISENNKSAEIQSEGDTKLLPDDFPEYENLVLIESSQTQTEGKRGLSILWETENPSSNVYDFYKQELVEKEWIVSPLVESQDSYTLSFKKGKTSGFLGLTKKDSKTTTLSVTMGIE